MAHQIANVTATFDGDQVEDHDDITSPDFASLLQAGDEIIVHEIHDETQVQKLKKRYSYKNRWQDKVTLKTELVADE